MGTDDLELTEAERQVISDLAALAGGIDLPSETADAVIKLAHLAAREEIASLAGLAMRRLQDEAFTRSFEHNAAVDAAKAVMGHFWGEVLAEYGSRDGADT